MAIRTNDGLVHRIDSNEKRDYFGILKCGILYSVSSRYRPDNGRNLASVTRDPPTCILCIGVP